MKFPNIYNAEINKYSSYKEVLLLEVLYYASEYIRINCNFSEC